MRGPVIYIGVKGKRKIRAHAVVVFRESVIGELLVPAREQRCQNFAFLRGEGLAVPNLYRCLSQVLPEIHGRQDPPLENTSQRVPEALVGGCSREAAPQRL